LYELAEGSRGDAGSVRATIAKALELRGLSTADAATLLAARDPESRTAILEAAGKVKDLIYGSRLVLFAPLYVGNACSNDCSYCSFRSGNHSIKRKVLSLHEVDAEVRCLLGEGHKRLLMLQGETDSRGDLDYFLSTIRAAYAAREGNASIKRINVEIAPLEVEGFRRLKAERIGTYACFQETYDPDLYSRYHLSGRKADYEWRLGAMDRAMEGGIDDVGIGALFGLAPWRFEVLAMMEHAAHLEERFGCGPHTVSVPRIEPAEGSPLSESVPYPVADGDFKLIVATLRLAMPYVGIILSTRETEAMRDELFKYGVSQISAGSRTGVGSYSEGEAASGTQFQLGDHRSLEEVIESVVAKGYIPSFCTGCYRKGRVGADFMDLAKPGLIKRFCQPNAMFTFAEYLRDYAGQGSKERGFALIESRLAELPDLETTERAKAAVEAIKLGESDVYF
jgi:2-iminoacetate synthase